MNQSQSGGLRPARGPEASCTPSLKVPPRGAAHKTRTITDFKNLAVLRGDEFFASNWSDLHGWHKRKSRPDAPQQVADVIALSAARRFQLGCYPAPARGVAVPYRKKRPVA